MNQRELGMLAGLHAGDSLGATLEFKQPQNPKNWLRDIVGGGPFRLNPGEASDDTEMMLIVLSSIASRKTFSRDHCVRGFIKWYDSKPKDIGNTTAISIEELKSGRPTQV